LRLNYRSLARCKRDTEPDCAQAIKLARSALIKAKKFEFTTLETKALIELGVLAADAKCYEQALRYYYKAAQLARHSSDEEAVSVAIGNAAIVRKNMGGARRLGRALRNFEESLAIARSVGDKRSEGRTIGNLGVLHSVMGNPLLAIDHFKEAIKIARELGDRYHEAVWLVGHADDSFAFNPLEAVALIQEGRAIFKDLGSEVRVLDCDAHLRRFGS
jgi:tetratricopeptide (TPR) repeat protein